MQRQNKPDSLNYSDLTISSSFCVKNSKAERGNLQTARRTVFVQESGRSFRGQNCAATKAKTR